MRLLWTVVRWLAVVPIAVGLHDLVLSAYPPVGAFLGGYLWPWTYQVVFLGFALAAALIGVSAAVLIAPSHTRTVALIGLGCAIAYALAAVFSMRNPAWSAWYCVVYLICVAAGAGLPYWVVREIDELSKGSPTETVQV